MTQLRQAAPEHRAWLEARIGRPIDPEGFRGIEAVDDEGRILAMVGFEFWTEGSAGVHLASDDHALRALGPEYAPEVLGYVFGAAGKRALWAMVAEGNEPVRRLARHYGFREVGRVPDGHRPGEALLLLALHRDWTTWK